MYDEDYYDQCDDGAADEEAAYQEMCDAGAAAEAEQLAMEGETTITKPCGMIGQSCKCCQKKFSTEHCESEMRKDGIDLEERNPV